MKEIFYVRNYKLLYISNNIKKYVVYNLINNGTSVIFNYYVKKNNKVYIMNMQSSNYRYFVQTIIKILNVSKNITPSMELVGLAEVSSTFKIDYSDPGVISKNIYNEFLPSYIISIDNNILSTQIPVLSTNTLIPVISTLPIGKYNIVYQSTYNGNKKTISRIINIKKNTIKPIMELVGLDEVSTILKTDYSGLGVTSKSFYNETLTSYIISIGDTILTSPIEVLTTDISISLTLTVGTYTIVYNSTDYDSNLQSITRKLTIIPSISSSSFVAYVINTTYPNIYDSTTSNFTTPITWDSGINTSNIIWSYKQKSYIIQNPTLISLDDSKPYLYFPNSSSKQAFTLSKNILKELNVDINSTWCFVIKLKYYSTPHISIFELNMDTDTSSWFNSPNNSSGVGSGDFCIRIVGNHISYLIRSYFPYTMNLEISGSLVDSITDEYDGACIFHSGYNLDTLLTNGIFIKFYKTDETTIGCEFINSDGVVLLSFKRKDAVMYHTVNAIPFYIYQEIDTYKFYDGFLYNKNDIPFSSYNTSFLSGLVFD